MADFWMEARGQGQPSQIRGIGSSRLARDELAYCLHRHWPITSIVSGSVTQVSHSSK